MGWKKAKKAGRKKHRRWTFPSLSQMKCEAEGPFDLDMVFKAVHVDDLPEGEWNCQCQRGAPCSICPERRELILLALKPFHIFCEKGAGFASLYLTKIAC